MRVPFGVITEGLDGQHRTGYAILQFKRGSEKGKQAVGCAFTEH